MLRYFRYVDWEMIPPQNFIPLILILILLTENIFIMYIYIHVFAKIIIVNYPLN